jgi:hypothetical protein
MQRGLAGRSVFRQHLHSSSGPILGTGADASEGRGGTYQVSTSSSINESCGAIASSLWRGSVE